VAFLSLCPDKFDADALVARRPRKWILSPHLPDRRQKILLLKTPRAEAFPMGIFCRDWRRRTAENGLQKPLCPNDFRVTDFLP